MLQAASTTALRKKPGRTEYQRGVLTRGEDGRWQLPEDDETRSKEGLKDLRDGKPVSAKIVSAIQRGDRAILRVEGVDRDDIKRAGRVLMVKEGGAWRTDTQDLGSVD